MGMTRIELAFLSMHWMTEGCGLYISSRPFALSGGA
jgi:hypothetical protein